MAAANSSAIKVYVLQSTVPLFKVEEDLERTVHGHVYLNVIYRRDPQTRQLKPTRDKSLLICAPQTATQLESIDPQKYRIQSYNWESFPNPRTEEGETNDLHITGIPNTMRQDDAVKMVRTFVSSLRMPESSYEVDMTVGSRVTGKAAGYGTIKFGDDVPYETRQLFKLMLHNREITEGKFVNCTWHNPNVRKTRRNQSSSETEIPAAEARGSSSIGTTRPVRVKSFRTTGTKQGLSFKESRVEEPAME